MQTIEIAATGRVTTRLGFGSSGLMGSISRADSLRLLCAAYEAGCRHFDTAPLYGFGEAEECVGEFAASHSDVTLTTKYGLAPPKEGGVLRLARRAAVPIVKRLPQIKKRLSAAAASVRAPIQRLPLSAGAARASLERSLTKLRREHVDVWLLHEAEAGDLEEEGLLRFLEDAVAQGKIATFGVGSDASKVQEVLHEHPNYCPVVQFEWSVFDPVPEAGGPFRFHHRALNENFTALHSALVADAYTACQWSNEVGHDLCDRRVLARLMLKASLVLNPESIVLFFSRSPEHLRENSRVLDDPTLEAPARRLYDLVQRDRANLLQPIKAGAA